MSRAKSKLAKDFERETQRQKRIPLTPRQKANFIFTSNCLHDEDNKDIVFTPETEIIIFKELKAEFKTSGIPINWDNRQYGEVLNRAIFDLPDVTVRFS